MAHTYPGYEPIWLPEQYYPMLLPTGQYQPFSPRDEYWPTWDLSSNAYEQKNHGFQSHLNPLSGHLVLHSSIPDIQSSYDLGRLNRHVSPTMSHHSSSTFSESSTVSDCVHTPEASSQSMNFATGSAIYSGPHTFRIPDLPTPQNAIWPSRTHESYVVPHPQCNFSSFIPYQPTLPSRQLDMVVQHDDVHSAMLFDDETDAMHSASPLQMPQPEELELAGDSDNSDMRSIADNSSNTSTTKHSILTPTTDEETEEEEEEEPMAVDHDSDSDYDNRPNRRRGSRFTPKQKHARKPSNNIIISPTSRVHKRTSSSSTTTSTASTATARTPTQRSPRPSKSKQRLPTFLTSKPPNTLPKSDRTYPCTFHRFGCTVEFPNKNEWKRHVACQHLQLGYYRCDLDACNPDSSSSPSSSSSSHHVSPAVRHGRRGPAHSQPKSEAGKLPNEIIKVYNRKDLFTQHCRRMHGPTRNPLLCSRPPSKKTGQLNPTEEDEAAFEVELTAIRARCWHVRRPAPARSSCGFCKKVFDAEYADGSVSACSGSGSGKEAEGNAEEKAWEERMEHVGRHYEKEGFERGDEEVDEDLVEWGVRTGVLRVLGDGRAWLVGAGAPGVESEGRSIGRGIGSGNGRGKTCVDGACEENTDQKKARRQPSRTVVRERRVSFLEDVVVVMVKGEGEQE